MCYFRQKLVTLHPILRLSSHVAHVYRQHDHHSPSVKLKHPPCFLPSCSFVPQGHFSDAFSCLPWCIVFPRECPKWVFREQYLAGTCLCGAWREIFGGSFWPWWKSKPRLEKVGKMQFRLWISARTQLTWNLDPIVDLHTCHENRIIFRHSKLKKRTCCRLSSHLDTATISSQPSCPTLVKITLLSLHLQHCNNSM